MRVSLMALLLFVSSVMFTGCGGGEPGSTITDETPAAPAGSAISEDPNEVANQMGDDYKKSQK